MTYLSIVSNYNQEWYRMTALQLMNKSVIGRMVGSVLGMASVGALNGGVAFWGEMIYFSRV